ncbi:MAG TPA: heavy metal-binding domain-containing protein [Labilithrix sp.]|jgi:uncharacterized protein YbjQ (UPF0145 family)
MADIPQRAQERIKRLVSSPNPFFTSTLSTNETVIARATGLRAISQVMGSSIFHVGFINATSWGGGELTTLTAAYDQARSLALSRMEQEARLLGAHLVIDVQLVQRGYDWGEDLLEFSAIGTAVRIDGQPPAPPILTLLKADELYKLHKAGYWPAGIALGNCFWYERHADCTSEGNWYSQELPSHTFATQHARDLAVGRFRKFAAHFGAQGVVGVHVHRHAHDHHENGHINFSLDLMVWGTAVVRRGNAAPPPRPRLVVDLE